MNRHFAALAAAALLTAAAPPTPDQVRAMPSTAPVLTAHYGPAPEQIGELRVPKGRGPFPVAVVIHGGCWTKGFDTLAGTRPLASALADKGIATWNVEYRQVGDAGGGWPGSFQDWGAATDYLRRIAKARRLDLKRVVVVGHSAGAHAALWVAARSRLPKTSDLYVARPLKPVAAVAIDGPGDLAPFAMGTDAAICGKPVIAPLMGGMPVDKPVRYREGSPYALQPLGARQYLLSASDVLTPIEANRYKAHGEGLGDTVEVTVVPPGNDHFSVIAPGTPAFAQVEAAVRKAVGR